MNNMNPRELPPTELSENVSFDEMVSIMQEISSSPEGSGVARFIKGSFRLGLDAQIQQKVPGMVADLITHNVIAPESGKKLLSFLEQPSLEAESVHSYWLSSDTAKGYTEELVGEDDNGRKVFLEKVGSITADLKTGDKVIDLGAGTGLISKAVIGSVPDGQQINIYGTDISPAMMDNNLLRAEYKDFAIADLQKGIPVQYQELDPKLIVSVGVFLYFNPEGMRKIISDMSVVMDESGTLCFTVMILKKNNLPSAKDMIPIYDFSDQEMQVGSGDPEKFYNYYNEEWIQSLLDQNNLEVAEAQDFSWHILEVGEYPARLYICKKKSKV